ncbi:MAG: lysozyme [Alphaproteobacteria bacterium]|nr:lysozyme [Alphaproteobacteria bacterium]
MAKALAQRFEGLRLVAYHDAAGFPTQGYGRLLARERFGDLARFPPIDEATADAWLAEDLALAARALARLCPVPLADGQRAALIDFAFNLGAGNLQASALRRMVIEGRHGEVPAELMRWVHAGGVRLAGLVRRRREEGEVYAAA